MITRLKRRGVAIIYITHKFEELPQIADDAIVMRDGRLVACGTVRRARRATQIMRLMVGRETWRSFLPEGGRRAGDEVLRAEGLTLPQRRAGRAMCLREATSTLSVRRGEVLGIFGLMGAGRTELLETLFGLHPRDDAGAFDVDGPSGAHRARPPTPSPPASRWPRKTASAKAWCLSMSVAENTSLACLRRLARAGLLDAAARAASSSRRYVEPLPREDAVAAPARRAT